MATITKLGEKFVAKTEATAASLNEQNAKIDELIDIFSKEGANGAGMNRTIAIPFTKGSSTVAITTLGTGLSVDDNTLNASTYTLPAASASALGGVKIKDKVGLSNSSGTISVNIDNSTIKINDEGKLYSTVSGGVTTAAMNTAITNAIGVLNANDTAVSGKYVSKVVLTNGVITVTRENLPFSLGTDLKYYVNTDEAGNNYSSLGVTILTGNFDTAINVSNGYTLVLMLAPSTNVTSIRDTQDTDIKQLFKAAGLALNSNKLYQVYYYSPGGNVAGRYTVKTT